MPDWASPVARYILEEGLPGMLRVAVVSLIGSTIIGITLGTLLTIHFRPSRMLIRLYIEVFRGLPIIVTVFLVYYGLPPLSATLQFSPLNATAIACILGGGARGAGGSRGAVGSIPAEQHEAAAALGFGWVGRHRYVILPQALRRLLPPLVSLLANIIQNTTIASLIGVTELLATGQRSIERLQFEAGAQSHDFEIYGAVMLAFFCISFPLTRLAIYLERRLV